LKDKFHSDSKAYLDRTELGHRKSLGQYFTPREVREYLLRQLPRRKNAAVLDPACGSGEFLISAGEYFNGCRLFGWEIDPELVRLSKRAVPQAAIERTDSLIKKCQQRFDFVIGNPPYFEFKPESGLREKYRAVITGRPNIFSMFVKLGLDLLKPGGYLAYVIPPSMNNGAYFAGLRDYIVGEANIEYLRVLDSSSLFHSAQQMVMILVLRKGPNKGTYLFRKSGLTIFSPDASTLRRAFKGKTTLLKLGITVRTGRIVWNQHKDRLTNSKNRAVPLIWAHNITGDGLALGHGDNKPQYIRTDNCDTGPAVVVNRVTGASKNVRLKAALIKPGFRFVGENHVNVLFPPEEMSTREQIKLLTSVCRQINAPETSETMRLVTGNTQVSRTELLRLMPFDV